MDLHSSAVRRYPVEVRIGCSGWQYTHWRNDFYPAGLPTARWFAHDLAEAATFERWREQAPARFTYAVKASRFLTHMKKLKDPDDPLFRFLDHVKHLGTTRWLADRVDEGRAVFAYFNNDVGGHAPRDAVRLRNRVKRPIAA